MISEVRQLLTHFHHFISRDEGNVKYSVSQNCWSKIIGRTGDVKILVLHIACPNVSILQIVNLFFLNVRPCTLIY